MYTKAIKQGKDFVVCIPGEMAEKLGLEDGSEVDLHIVNGVLRMYPSSIPFYTREELVAGITPENRHEAVDWGPPVGKEVW